MRTRILHGHAPDVLRGLEADSVQCVVTSPPYWGLRSYGTEPQVWGGDSAHAHEWGGERLIHAGNAPSQRSTLTTNGGRGPKPGDKYEAGRSTLASQGAFCHCGAWRGELGLEPTPDLYVEHLVGVFREVRRVLRPDGVCWINLGDSYATGAGAVGQRPGGGSQGDAWAERGAMTSPNRMPIPGLKPKDLVGIPWRVAFALQADGWWLRSEVIWHKPNPMPESVSDRPTKAHEQVFLLTKSASYFYDAEAIKETVSGTAHARGGGVHPKSAKPGSGIKANESFGAVVRGLVSSRNSRSVWTIATQPSPVAHFATYPQELAERCILAGTSERGACVVCGAPWARVVNVAYTNPGNRSTNGPRSIERRHAEFGTAGYAQRLERRATTTGWAPTCEHAAPLRPCLVLDPFSGTGTTGKAALKLGRDYVGIDLHPGHTRTAQRRLTMAVDGPLFGGDDARVS
jgi:DNA modification methylase